MIKSAITPIVNIKINCKSVVYLLVMLVDLYKSQRKKRNRIILST